MDYVSLSVFIYIDKTEEQECKSVYSRTEFLYLIDLEIHLLRVQIYYKPNTLQI